MSVKRRFEGFVARSVELLFLAVNLKAHINLIYRQVARMELKGGVAS
jgi:hypothetical protein